MTLNKLSHTGQGLSFLFKAPGFGNKVHDVKQEPLRELDEDPCESIMNRFGNVIKRQGPDVSKPEKMLQRKPFSALLAS